MSLTLVDIIEKLRHVDEISLLEVLEITSDEIVDRFEDRIEEKADYLQEDLQ